MRVFLWRMRVSMFDDMSVRHVQTYGMVPHHTRTSTSVSQAFRSSRFSCLYKRTSRRRLTQHEEFLLSFLCEFSRDGRLSNRKRLEVVSRVCRYSTILLSLSHTRSIAYSYLLPNCKYLCLAKNKNSVMMRSVARRV